MDPRQLIRDAATVKADLVILPDGQVITKSGCLIQIPARFAERGLAYLGMENHIVGVYAMIVGGTHYAVSMVNAMHMIFPSDSRKVKVNGDDYFEFIFMPGTPVFKSLQLVKTDSIVYKIYDEIFSKGYKPWYLDYNDLGRIFDTARKHAGAKIGENQEVTELIVSLVARNRDDKTQYYRSTITDMKDLMSNPPEFIALRDVTYAATNTTNRLGGSYTRVGIVAALNNPSDRTERIESLLRA